MANHTSVTSVFSAGTINVCTDPAGSNRYEPAVFTSSGYSSYFHAPDWVKAYTSPVCLCVGTR